MSLKNTFQTMNNTMFKVNPSKFVFLINEIHKSMVHCKRTEFQYANLKFKSNSKWHLLSTNNNYLNGSNTKRWHTKYKLLTSNILQSQLPSVSTCLWWRSHHCLFSTLILFSTLFRLIFLVYLSSIYLKGFTHFSFMHVWH